LGGHGSLNDGGGDDFDGPTLGAATPAPVAAAGVRAGEDDDDAAALTLPPVPASRIWAMNRPEFGAIVVGLIAAGVNGAVQPVMSIVFTRMLNELYYPVADADVRSGRKRSGRRNRGCRSHPSHAMLPLTVRSARRTPSSTP